MTYRPDPANDPNEAYAVIPTRAELRGPVLLLDCHDRWYGLKP